MAEALGAVGVAASFIQLVDASLRTSLCLYAFFSAIRNAQPEIQHHLILIRGIHDTIQLVRKTANEAALGDDDKTRLSRHLKSITDDLSLLGKVTEGKDPAKFGAKIKWIMKKPEMRQALQNLESHKTSLLLQLQALDIGQSGRILSLQNSSSAELASIKSLLEQQNKDATILNSNIQAGLVGLHTRMDSSLNLYMDRIEASRNQNPLASENYLDQAIRRALDKHILPQIEERFLARSEINNAATLSQVKAVMAHATDQILGQMGKSPSNDVPSSSRDSSINRHSRPRASGPPRPSSKLSQPDSSLSAFGQTEMATHFSQPSSTNSIRHLSTWRAVMISQGSYSISIPHIGTFLIVYGTYAGPKDRFWTIKLDFWPAIARIATKCISLKYSSRRDPQGYMALCPSVAIRPIVPTDRELLMLIHHEDSDGLIRRFQTHQNGPLDQFSDGMSLLEYALLTGSYRIAQLLLFQGADPTRVDQHGVGGLDYLILSAASNTIFDSKPIHGEHLSIFFSMFHFIVAAGCDPDSSMFGGSRMIRDEKFQALRFNQDEEESEDEGGMEEYLARIRSLAQFLKFQGFNLLDSKEVVQAILSPSKMTLPVLQELGLKGNYQLGAETPAKSILYVAILAFREPQAPLDLLVENLISLVSNGADIYDIAEPAVANQDFVLTPTMYAYLTGIIPEWMYALEQAGYDPVEVIKEDELRRRESQRLHGARSSAVEVPRTASNSGIRRRLV